MNTRLVSSLLCAGAVALACGSRTHAGQAATEPLAATAATVATAARVSSTRPASRHRTAEAKLSSSFGVHVDRSDVRFALNVTNVGDKHVELAFPSGQAYDFVVVDSLGREVWRWAKGRMFTQTMRTKLLGSGDAYQVDERWTPASARGKYTAIAMLNSSNYPVEERVDFEIR